MVRGVHKKIIEVADTQNEFFERAILIVKRRIPERRSGASAPKSGGLRFSNGKRSAGSAEKEKFLRRFPGEGIGNRCFTYRCGIADHFFALIAKDSGRCFFLCQLYVIILQI